MTGGCKHATFIESHEIMKRKRLTDRERVECVNLSLKEAFIHTQMYFNGATMCTKREGERSMVNNDEMKYCKISSDYCHSPLAASSSIKVKVKVNEKRYKCVYLILRSNGSYLFCFSLSLSLFLCLH